MIKRLKWNVLHGGGGGEESDGGLTSSSESDADDSRTTNALLHQLVENDQELSEILYQNLATIVSSSDDSNSDSEPSPSAPPQRRRPIYEDSSDEEEDIVDKPSQNSLLDDTVHEHKRDGSEQSGADEDEKDGQFNEWQECTLCPGKRFLSSKEVDAHLVSKRHLKRTARFDKTASSEAENDSGAKTTEIVENDEDEQEARKLEKRKAASKQKLKALKQRKWKKRQELEKKNQQKLAVAEQNSTTEKSAIKKGKGKKAVSKQSTGTAPVTSPPLSDAEGDAEVGRTEAVKGPAKSADGRSGAKQVKKKRNIAVENQPVRGNDSISQAKRRKKKAVSPSANPGKSKRNRIG